MNQHIATALKEKSIAGQNVTQLANKGSGQLSLIIKKWKKKLKCFSS